MALTRARILLCLVLVGACAAKAEKPQTWIEVRSPHFVVVSDAKEKQARRVALHFELVRAVFQKSFPRARVDPVGQVTVLAARNESTLKELLPAFWEEKGHLHPSGIFVRGPEKNFVVLRVDVSSEDAYHTIYHEYVHLLVSLNVPWLPTWLNEGMAEVYGNSYIGERVVELGRPSKEHVALLRQHRLLPLDALLSIDKSSPYYNEAEKASIFYAESWALTHMLMFGDRMQHSQKLVEFLGLIGSGMDQRVALQRTFGDLKALEERLDDYVRQASMGILKFEPPHDINEDEFSVREISAAESAAVRGDFELHNGREAEAQSLLEEALRLDPNLALAHESLGFLFYQRGEKEEAAEQFEEAVKLDSRSYLAHYYNALLTIQNALDPESIALAEKSLRRALELNPEFGYAASALAGLYVTQEHKPELALPLAEKAVQLEPSEISHYLNLGNVLLRLDRADEAEKVGQQALRVAKDARETSRAQTFLGDVQRYKEFRAERKRADEESRAAREKWDRRLEEEQKSLAEKPREEVTVDASHAAAGDALVGNLRARVEGTIVELGCTPRGKMNLTIELPSYKLELHANDYHQIEFLAAGGKPPDSFDPCKQMRGMKARVTYMIDEQHAGEIVSVELAK
jgi:tetratricopeptide (TPR) repeat protein